MSGDGICRLHIAEVMRAGLAQLGYHPRQAEAMLAEFRASTGTGASYQERTGEWMTACFTPDIVADITERVFRFGEEAHEFMQAMGCTEEEAIRLVRYTWGRPKGEPGQEVGGVMVTLAAACNAAGLNFGVEAERELARCWERIEKIRAKHAAKPQGVRSALPGVVADQPGENPGE